MAIWKDAHFILLCVIKWVGHTDPKGVAGPTWQLLMEILRDYFNSISMNDDHKTPAHEMEQLDIEVS